MNDIVERLRFDATRCELQFSKGVARNIDEAADKIVRLRAALQSIADNTCCQGCQEAARVAKIALTEMTPDEDKRAREFMSELAVVNRKTKHPNGDRT